MIGILLSATAHALPGDDLAAAITPVKARFSAGTSQSNGTAGWADIDDVHVEIQGKSTPVHGVTIPVGTKWKYTQGNWREHFAYILNGGSLKFKDFGQPNMSSQRWVLPETYGSSKDKVTFRRPTLTESWNYVTSQISFSKIPELRGYTVVGNYYINESASKTKGRDSDWFTAATNFNVTNGGNYDQYLPPKDDPDEPDGYYEAYFSRHAWIQVLKSEAVRDQPARALLFVVAFSLQQTDMRRGSSTTPVAGWPWAVRFNEIRISDITNQNATAVAKPLITVTNVDSVATKGSASDHGLVRISRSGPITTTLSVAARWTKNPSGSGGAQVLLGSTNLASSFTVPFSAGQASRDIVVKGLTSAIYTPNEAVSVSVTDQPHYDVDSARRSATVNVVDPSPPVATITATQPDAYLPNPNGAFRVALSREASVPITVRYGVVGTAPANVRYRALSGTVTFPARTTTSNIPVIPIQTNAVTPVQTVITNLTSGSDYSLGNPRSATVNIHDNHDNVFSIVADNAATRAGGPPASFKVVRSGDNLAPITLSWNLTGDALASTHYTPSLPTFVTFGQNVREMPFTLNAVAGLAANRILGIELVGRPQYTLGVPSSADLQFQGKPPVTKVHINATIFSGASIPADAVDAWVPEGVTVKGGIIALGNGDVPPSSQPPTLIPQPEYLDGTWIPPVVPYGIDIRLKHIRKEAQ